MNIERENSSYEEHKYSFAPNNNSQSEKDTQLTNRKCNNCGNMVSNTADICENCGEWLLKGKCNFCYTDSEFGQKFCSECGNPPEGIICSKCGNISHFDFCPSCSIPLTEQAIESINLMRNTYNFETLKEPKTNDSIDIIEKTKDSDDRTTKLKNYLSKLLTREQQKKSRFRIYDNPNSEIEEKLKSLKESRQNVVNKKQKELEKRKKEKENQKLLDEIKSKTFSNNQEARRFFNALKIIIQTEERELIGWKCNAYGVTHSVGPHECADSSKGGIWIYRTVKKEKSIII